MAKRGVIDHPKFQRLKVLLKLNRACALGYLEAAWQFTGRFTPQGNIGKYQDAEIEAWVEWDGEEGALIAALIKCGWLEEHPEHRLIVHDWCDHVDHTTAQALRRAGLEPIGRCSNDVGRRRAGVSTEERQEPSDEESVSTPCAQSENADSTPCAERENRQSQSQSLGISPPLKSPPPDGLASGLADVPPPGWWAERYGGAWASFDAWWGDFLRAYPPRLGDRKTSLGEAVARRLLRAGKGDLPDRILAGAVRYRRFMEACGKSKTEYVQQLPTWLRGEAWKEAWELPEKPEAKRFQTHLAAIEEVLGS